MRTLVRASALIAIAAISFLAAPAAEAGILRYEIFDHYDLFRPDLTPGDPLDKGFSVSGTIEAERLGVFASGDAPFRSWNITVTVGSPSGPTESYNFTPANSTWTLDQTPNDGFAALEITDEFIWLEKTYIPGVADSTNSLDLDNETANQALLYATFGGSGLPWIFQSTTITPQVADGTYVGSGGRLLIGVRNAHVPEPASLAVWGLGAAVAGVSARRRKKNA